METFRYIITRACLQEGSLRLQRYLKPHFPPEGTVRLFDDSGHEYGAEISQGERLLGVGPFYRDHNLSVNDVVMITPLLPGCYKVEGIVKPYARPEPAPERERGRTEAAVAAEPVDESGVRVVVHASAHVREVRLQRPEGPVAQPWASMERETAERAERAGRYAVPPLARGVAATDEPKAAQDSMGSKRVHRIRVPSSGNADSGDTVPLESRSVAARVPVMPVHGTESESFPPVSLPAALLETGGVPEAMGRRDQRADSRADVPQVAVGASVRPVRTPQPPQRETSVLEARQAGADVPARPPAALQEPSAQLPRSGSASAASQRLLRDLASAPAEVRRASRSGGDVGKPGELPSSSGLEVALPAGGMTRADGEGLLDTLGRRCGYRVDYPAANLTRLRTGPGAHSHTVLVASGGSAINTAEWREAQASAPTYRLWLTSEAQATLDAPVVTYEALHRLTASVLRLSPLELHPVWESGALNEAVALDLLRQQASEQQETATFLALLRVLAQQPAHSLVTAARLAGQLHAGPLQEVDATQLNRLLTLLSRTPFRLLAPLGSGQYLLRREISQFLEETAQEWQDLAGEIGQIRGGAMTSQLPEPQSWTADRVLG
ncbi:hypothetical protein [Deinococcus sp. SL84]|uniref:hypothetical protein n=1 Tax=Deinococcus sp. SL84 TaxID=2994663 RepID=UPI002276DC1B|nr:hypothetical protein [Deinococcus sp. SL84]MCY1701816.1 hypothetical protein [Deinococcus sp. SL84]